MKKSYYIDASTLLRNPKAFYAFNGDIIISDLVIAVLKRFQNGNNDRNVNARAVLRLLDTCILDDLELDRLMHKDAQPIQIKTVRFDGNHKNLILLLDNPENRVDGKTYIEKTLNLIARHRFKIKSSITMITEDKAMATIAIGHGLEYQPTI